jgi:hypothetical protein
MDAITYLELQVAALRRQANMTLAETTDQQLNWSPPGTANSIAVTLLHNIAGEDLFIQSILQGKALVWETQGWGEKIGIAQAPGGGQGWEEARQATFTLAPILAYQEAVSEATHAYIAGLTPEALDRPVPVFGAEQPVGAVLALVISHILGHLGEIAAIKGIQGVKGLPF